MPQNTVLHITADHGMVDVQPQDHIDLDDGAGLRDGVALLGGEPRARHVYAEPGAAADVLAAWREILGSRAWVASRDEAIASGWFGPVAGPMVARVGDVVAAPAGPVGAGHQGRARRVGSGGHARLADHHGPAGAAPDAGRGRAGVPVISVRPT